MKEFVNLTLTKEGIEVLEKHTLLDKEKDKNIRIAVIERRTTSNRKSFFVISEGGKVCISSLK